MDYAKLKRRPSYPIETIAVSVAFTPRLGVLLAEAHKLTQQLSATLLIIHIGEKTQEKEDYLEGAFHSLGINQNEFRIIWMEGDVVDTLLHVCKLNIVDLLILGALPKEQYWRLFAGSISRSICRKAKTSVLLLNDPLISIQHTKRVVVNGKDHPKTPHTINTAVYFLDAIGVKEFTVVTEIENSTLAMTMAEETTAPEALKIKKDFTQEELSRITPLLNQLKESRADFKINEKIIYGKAGYEIRSFAKKKHADLLIVNSSDRKLNMLDRLFTHGLEYILEDLPCNLLIVHSRV